MNNLTPLNLSLINSNSVGEKFRKPIAEDITSTANDNISKLSNQVFRTSSQSEIEKAYQLIETFVSECNDPDLTVDGFIDDAAAGAKLYQEAFIEGPKDNYSTKEFKQVYTFILSQTALTNRLHHNGTIKFPDPGNTFASIAMNTTATYHGQQILPKKGELPTPKGRWTSHFPEKQSITEKTPIKLHDGSFACFSKKARASLIKQGVSPTNIRNVGKPGVCIDSSGNDPSIKIPGKGKNTYLLQFFPEKNSIGEEVPTVAIKTEGFSAVKIGEAGYGKVTDRIRDNVLHIGQWFKKKGSSFLQKRATNESQFRELKEDKLNNKIKEQLSKFNISSYKGNKFGNKAEKELYKSYRTLRKTTGGKSEYGFQELNHHLDLIRRHLINEHRRTGSENTLHEIGEVSKAQQEISQASNPLRGLSSKWGDHLLPRSEEVILPRGEIMLGLEREGTSPGSTNGNYAQNTFTPDRFDDLTHNLNIA